MEAADTLFYSGLMENPALEEFRSAFETIAAALKKNEKELLRARRENVTEMILEPIQDFDSRAFLSDRKEVPADAALAAAVALESKAVGFYARASEKMRALPEVSRLLARLGRIRSANQVKLNELIR